jgi:hypothetical protein
MLDKFASHAKRAVDPAPQACYIAAEKILLAGNVARQQCIAPIRSTAAINIKGAYFSLQCPELYRAEAPV